jgi:putative membrane protein
LIDGLTRTQQILFFWGEYTTNQGVAISLFLGFHNNASYGRWWEARILWGRQIIVTRDLARFLLGTMAVVDEEKEDDDDPTNNPTGCENEEDGSRQKKVLKTLRTVATLESSSSLLGAVAEEEDVENNFQSMESEPHAITTLTQGHNRSKYIYKRNDPRANKYSSWQAHIICLSVAHSHAFRYQMRPLCKSDGLTTALQDRDRFLNPEEQKYLLQCKNNANTILFMASKILGKAHKEGNIDTYSMIHVQNILNSMCEIQTACERIQNTSLPLAYSLLVHRTSVMYVLLVPFAIAPNIGWWTPLFTAIVAYTFFGLDELAKQIQEPFRDNPMCLALSAMCRTIEIDALEALGEETPGYLKPRRNVLM